jgi:hypothetical protein
MGGQSGPREIPDNSLSRRACCSVKDNSLTARTKRLGDRGLSNASTTPESRISLAFISTEKFGEAIEAWIKLMK